MLKAKVTGDDGRPLYIFGLSAENVRRLLAGDPIYFDGAEVDLAGHHFLIAHAEDATVMRRLHDHFARNDPRRLHSWGLSRGSLARLAQEPAEIEGMQEVHGRVLLMVGEEHELAEAFGISTAPVRSGFRDVFDPLTGTMRRIPNEPGS
jgi:hypothetical protein